MILPLPSSPHWVPITMTNLPMALTNQKENCNTDKHAAQACDAQLPVAYIKKARQCTLHAARIKKRCHALQHKEQGNRGNEIRQVGHDSAMRALRRAAD